MSQYDDLVNRFAELGSKIMVLEEELEKKDAEILEQARLIGKSAEREADLLGKLERKDKLCRELLECLKKYPKIVANYEEYEIRNLIKRAEEILK